MNTENKTEPLVDFDVTDQRTGVTLEQLKAEMRAGPVPNAALLTRKRPSAEQLYDDPVEACRVLDQLNTDFYWMCFRAGVGVFAHAFLEFNGLMSKYISCLRKAKVPPHAVNVHAGEAFEVADHDIEYLAEKLECIFAPIIAANPNAREILMRHLFNG